MKIYESQTLLITLSCLSFVVGIYPLSDGLFNDRIFTSPTNIIYAKENTKSNNQNVEKAIEEYGAGMGKTSGRLNKSIQGKPQDDTRFTHKKDNFGRSRILGGPSVQDDLSNIRKNRGSAIPKSDVGESWQKIRRTNRKTGKDELVYVPKGIGEAICDPKYKWDCNKALTVVSCESDFKKDAVSRTKDIGWFQINPIHGYSVSYLLDAGNNIGVAYKLYLRRGWKDWYSSFKCHRLT